MAQILVYGLDTLSSFAALEPFRWFCGAVVFLHEISVGICAKQKPSVDHQRRRNISGIPTVVEDAIRGSNDNGTSEVMTR